MNDLHSIALTVMWILVVLQQGIIVYLRGKYEK